MKSLLGYLSALCVSLMIVTSAAAQGTISITNLQVDSATIKPYGSIISAELTGTVNNNTDQDLRSIRLELTMSQGYQSADDSETCYVSIPKNSSMSFHKDFSISTSSFYSGLDILKKIDWSVKIKSTD